jgi:hypothetical protein
MPGAIETMGTIYLEKHGGCTAFWTNDNRLAKAAPQWSENVL